MRPFLHNLSDWLCDTFTWATLWNFVKKYSWCVLVGALLAHAKIHILTLEGLAWWIPIAIAIEMKKYSK